MINDIACIDCIMILANDDDSGMADGQAHRVKMSNNIPLGEYPVPNHGGEPFFSNSPCGVCGETLAGDRFNIEWVVSRP